jgi:hypothetical protein
MVMQDLIDVDNNLTNRDLVLIVGGRSLSGPIINAFNNTCKTIYGFGQQFGGALRRIFTRNLCKF